MTEKKHTLSQSLLKALMKYAEKKECGLKVEAQYIDGFKTESTTAQALGNWFEYICTGALPPYNPIIPQPKTLQSGKLAVAYQRMEEQSKNFKKAIDYYKIKILHAGYDMKFGDYTGTADIIGEVDGRKVIIDLKSTGLFDDKWSDFGWNTEHLAAGFRPKVNLLIQALHYTWLWKKIHGEVIDFYFWVFSTQNTHDFKIIKVNIDPDLYDEHEQDLRTGLDFLHHNINNGFKAYPGISRCAKCFLKDNCKSKVDVPVVQTVDFGSTEKNYVSI